MKIDKFCRASSPEADSKIHSFDQTKLDIYTQETFQALYEKAKDDSRDLYVNVITQEDGHQYHYESYSFFLNIHLKPEAANPHSRLPIQDCAMYKVKRVVDGKLICKRAFTNEEIKNDPSLYRLPALWNSPDCSEENKRVFMLQFAQGIEKNQPNKALKIAQKVSQLGSISADYYLAGFFRRQHNPDKQFEYLERAILADPSPSINNALLYAFYLEKKGRSEEAYTYILSAAKQESFWGILKMLIYLEQQGKDPDVQQQAKEWRAILPETLRDKNTDEIKTYLDDRKYPLGHKGPLLTSRQKHPISCN